MSQVEQVKEASDIVTIIGERISLQRAGSQYRALCPFHSERSPSFFVSETMQRFKCFGCGESGDVYEFLQKYEGMSFGESLRYLADRAGIKLEAYQDSQEDQEKVQILAALELAAAYFHYLLTKHKAGEVARQYAKGRKITGSSIKLFRLGYSLPAWDGLCTYLMKKKGYKEEVIIKAGLAIKGRGGRLYDRFRDRLMFPLTNNRGQVVGFAGRLLQKDVKEAKYINSPETLVYHKSQNLFGLSQLRQMIRQKNQVVVVEGELDCISSAQAGVDNVVAIKGSAFTTDHARLLSRLVGQVLLSLDADDAGVEATKKAIKALSGYQLELRVIVLPEGKDPDELCATKPQVWRQAVGRSISAYEFLIRTSLAHHNIKESAGRTQVIRELTPVFATLTSSVEKQFYLERLAQSLQTKPELVARDLKLYHQGLIPATPTQTTTPTLPPKITKLMQLERSLLYLLLTAKDSDLTRFKLTDGLVAHAPLLRKYWSTLTAVHFNHKQALAQLDKTDQAIIGEIFFNPDLAESYGETDYLEVFKGLCQQLAEENIKMEKQQIARELNTIGAKSERTPQDSARENQLMTRLAQLTAKQKIST